MISLASNMTAIVFRNSRRALTATQETRVVAALIAVFLAGALATILHAITVATHW